MDSHVSYITYNLRSVESQLVEEPEGHGVAEVARSHAPAALAGTESDVEVSSLSSGENVSEGAAVVASSRISPEQEIGVLQDTVVVTTHQPATVITAVTVSSSPAASAAAAALPVGAAGSYCPSNHKTGSRFVPKSVTLNNLERRNGP